MTSRSNIGDITMDLDGYNISVTTYKSAGVHITTYISNKKIRNQIIPSFLILQYD